MRIRLYRLAIFLVLLAGCARPAAPALGSDESALYLYSPQKRALLQMRADFSGAEREVPLELPPCELSGLYAAPGGDRLAAEMICPNGPLALLIDPVSWVVSGFLADRNVDSHFLAWSADGETAYLRVGALGEPRILAVEAESLRARGLLLDGYTYDLAVRPEGRGIVYSLSLGLGLGSEMQAAQPLGGNPRLLLRDPQNILAFARWSPDGGHIAFLKIPDSQIPYTVGELWVMDPDGRNPRKLADADAGHGFAASWSPEGHRLAFVVRSNPEDARADRSLEALVSNIHVVDVSTGMLRQVTSNKTGRAGTPVWAPDGNTLSFEYVLNGRMEVQIADLTDSTPAPIHSIDAVCCPVWMRK